MFSFFQKKKGCLHGKTEAQKMQFFRSLSRFGISDPKFFEEQYWDLLPDERKEFKQYVKDQNKSLKTIKSMLDVVGKLLPTK